MKKLLVLGFVTTALACFLGGCASDYQATRDTPDYIENNAVTAHGAATVSYGHSVGH
jgi:hypothetical protein